ncbi:MAG TPA: FAD-dependent oxidoreductase [Bacteriovoracaceae bacterium]|nr:FAD-dependent oxidoreductase [Bacteriovoracaceae bacterium]
MNYDFDTIILGGGSVGSSILFELSQCSKQRVALVDQGRYSAGATVHSGGMIRAFHESSDHVELALNSQKLLCEYQARGVLTEKSISCGNLYFFHKFRFSGYQQSLKMMEDAAHPFEVLSPIQGKRRFPEFNWKEDEWAIYEPTATHLNPMGFCQDLITQSMQNGAKIFDHTEVTRLSRFRDQYKLFAGEKTFTCRILILAGGARMLPRLEDFGLSFPLEARTITSYTMFKKPELNLPHFFDREKLEFGRMGLDPLMVMSDPETDRLVSRGWTKMIGKRQAQDCYAPNRVGLLGEVSGHSRLILATGWGGTAFKFSLGIGKKIAELIEETLSERKRLYV